MVRYKMISGFIMLVVLISLIYVYEHNETSQKIIDWPLVEKKSEVKLKELPNEKLFNQQYTGSIYEWIGKTSDSLKREYGKPERQDLSAYGYEWWVYSDKDYYLQFGVEDGTIKTVYGTGDISIEPFEIGQTYKEINQDIAFIKEVSYLEKLNSYQFHLTDEEIKARPLIKLSQDVFIQLYFDTIKNQLSAIRVLTGDILLKHRPYEMMYRGHLPKVKELTDKEWRKVEKGMEKQIFDITNIFRKQFGVDHVSWDDNVSKVAYAHSKDMENKQYFSHYRLDGSGLKERLQEKDVYYLVAGENIAAQYPDAPSAMAGWLNSKGHREALLNKQYTHLGVGVYRLYYTQNFLGKP